MEQVLDGNPKNRCAREKQVFYCGVAKPFFLEFKLPFIKVNEDGEAGR